MSEIRAGEELDLQALARLLNDRFPGPQAVLEALQFPGGHSNLTYLIRRAGQEYVLRRPPLGPIPPRAHDMVREARILTQLAPLYPAAPRVDLICEDEAVLGRPFYLMERRRGWSRRWDAAQTSRSSAMDRLSGWLLANLPVSGRATVVHNDYKLDNVMLDEDDPSRITAVLDWEMTSVGDPLVDLGVMLSYWPESGDPQARREAISPLTAQPGWPSRAELLDRYHHKTGRDLSGVAYYEVFGLFKLAVVLEQIYRRYHIGQTTDARFARFEPIVRGLAEAAELVMETA